MDKMQWSIRKVQRAMIAAGIAMAVFVCARGIDVLWRYDCGVWTVDYGHVDVWTHGRSKFNSNWAKVNPKVANLAPN